MYRAFSVLSPPPMGSITMARKIEFIRQHATAIIEHPNVPWTALINRTSSPLDLAHSILDQAVSVSRDAHLPLYVMLEPFDPVDRSKESSELLALNQSIANQALWPLYHSFVIAVIQASTPRALGLASEINAIVEAQPKLVQPMYQMILQSIRLLQRMIPMLDLYVSYTAHSARQSIIPVPGIRLYSFSLYPHLVFGHPRMIPWSYLWSLRRSLPPRSRFLIDETGWPTHRPQGLDEQRIFMRRLRCLARTIKAELIAQVVTNDVSASYLGFDPWWASMGVADEHLTPKPAIQEWDALR